MSLVVGCIQEEGAQRQVTVPAPLSQQTVGNNNYNDPNYYQNQYQQTTGSGIQIAGANNYNCLPGMTGYPNSGNPYNTDYPNTGYPNAGYNAGCPPDAGSGQYYVLRPNFKSSAKLKASTGSSFQQPANQNPNFSGFNNQPQQPQSSGGIFGVPYQNPQNYSPQGMMDFFSNPQSPTGGQSGGYSGISSLDEDEFRAPSRPTRIDPSWPPELQNFCKSYDNVCTDDGVWVQ